jgi:hypothetical protein
LYQASDIPQGPAQVGRKEDAAGGRAEACSGCVLDPAVRTTPVRKGKQYRYDSRNGMASPPVGFEECRKAEIRTVC